MKDTWEGVGAGVCKKCMGSGKIHSRNVDGEKVVTCPKCGGSGKATKDGLKSLRAKYKRKE